MDSKTIVQVTRIVVGGAIFITSMITGANGTTHMLAMFLMGVPVELIPCGKSKKEE